MVKPSFGGTLRLNLGPKKLELIPEAVKTAPKLKPKKRLSDARINQRISDLAKLRDAYPNLFDPINPRPLAIGIHHKIAGILGSKRRTHTLLHWYCELPSYKKALAHSDVRYNLELNQSPKLSEQVR